MNDLFPVIPDIPESGPATRQFDLLIQSVSHELRSIFGVISGLHSLLPLAKDQAEQEDMFNRLHNNTEYATQLFADLEDYCSLEAGSVRPEPCTFRPAAILENVRKKVLPMLKRRQAAIRLDGDSEMLVNGDEGKLGRIAKNMIFQLSCIMRVKEIDITWTQRASNWELNFAYSGDALPEWLFYPDSEPFIPETARLMSLLLVRRLVSVIGGAIHGADVGQQRRISLQFPH